MTNPIEVSQRARILARQIFAWAQSTRLSAKDAEDFAAAAIDAFEAGIRADEREKLGNLQAENERLAKHIASGILPGLLDDEEKDALLDFVKHLRNQKDHDHE